MALVGELTALMLSHLLMSSPSRNSYISSGYGFGSRPRVHALAAGYSSQGTHQALSTHYVHSSPDGPGGQFSGLVALQRRKSEIRAERPGGGRLLPFTELLTQKAAVG